MILLEVSTDDFAWASCLIGAEKSCRVESGYKFQFVSNKPYILEFNSYAKNFVIKSKAKLKLPDTPELLRKADFLVDHVRKRDSGTQMEFEENCPFCTIVELAAGLVGAKTKKTHFPETALWKDFTRDSNLAVCFDPKNRVAFNWYLEELNYSGKVLYLEPDVNLESIELAAKAKYFAIPKGSDLIYAAACGSFKYDNLKNAGFGIMTSFLNPNVDRRRILNTPVVTPFIDINQIREEARKLRKMMNYNFDDHLYLKDLYAKERS